MKKDNHPIMKLITMTAEIVNHEATGAAMRTARLKAGKTLQDVANSSGLSAAYLSELERGINYWNERYLDLYRKALAK